MANSMRTGIVLAVLCCWMTACGDNDNNTNDNTGTQPTVTPIATPVGTATPPPQIPCPHIVTYQVLASQSQIDTGWTGVYAGIPAGDGGALSFAVDCPGDFLGQCGQCGLSGPVQSTTPTNNHRCDDDTSVVCTSDADCPGSTCSFYFGSPLAVSGGGFPICVVNRVAGNVTGTLSPELGAGASDFPLEIGMFTGLDVDVPCPTCSGDALGEAGVCSNGPHDGDACTVHGVGVLGKTSFDCPPAPQSRIGTTVAPFNLTTETRSLPATETCTAGSDKACYCPGQTQANACSDGVCTVSANGVGVCAAGPVDSECAIEFFRGCVDNSECPLPGDSCVERQRECLGPATAEAGATGPLTRVGTRSTSLPIQVGVFCVNATSSAAVNATSGLPGPGAVRLPTTICPLPQCPLSNSIE